MKRLLSAAVLALGFVFACGADHVPPVDDAVPNETTQDSRARVEIPRFASEAIRLQDPTTKMAVRFSLPDARRVATRLPALRPRTGMRAVYPSALPGEADLVLTMRRDGVEDSVVFPT